MTTAKYITPNYRVKDLTGKRFGRLVVLGYTGTTKQRSALWHCQCDCGETTEVSTNSLNSGNTKSCGCWGVEAIGDRCRTHGMYLTPTYKVWAAMKARCQNPNDQRYEDYGGRGITVCERWQDFPNFYEDMGDKPDGMSLDRIDNDGCYKKDNCTWSTMRQQQNNTRSNRVITFDGKTQTLAQWARQIGMNYATLRNRINRLHWSIEDALTTPTGAERDS